MNIQLPNKFFYSTDWKRTAYVDDNVLYIQGNVSYENLMYSLAYSISGYQKCIYCGEKLKKETRTLDHIYPRNWGGISIPDNLVPCCSSCNSKKSNMTAEQFERWLNTNSDKRAALYAKFVKENEKEMKTKYILPEEWVSSLNIDEVIDKLDFSVIEQFGNDKIDLYYQLHRHYPRPIIVSSNNCVLKGIHILYHAKVNGIKKVSCVKLDNVVKIKE